ncbi:BGTF surface domain-containing protein [Halobium salinum]|uniref:BGTF surface domain-containing protein n=1 Tax=Halobium salinum TaxID=1364940 RepID=A0ABD5PE51_9EURY|nr:BGTF surface domain-containing protein [Halobium salinum]
MKPSTSPPPGQVVPVATRVAAVFVLLGCLFVAPALALPADGPLVGATGAPHDATVAHDGDDLVLRTGPGQVVAGAANLTTGERVVVRIEAGGERPFVLSRPATVGSDGAFAVRFDLSARRPASNVTVSVLHDSRVLADVPAELRLLESTTTSPGSATAPNTNAQANTSAGTASASAAGPESNAERPPAERGVPLWFAGLLAVAAATLAAVVVRSR